MAEVIDLRVLSPFNPKKIIESVEKTGRLLVVDGGWKTAGMSAEVMASVCEAIKPTALLRPPVRITLPDAPAPTAKVLEQAYYTQVSDIVKKSKNLVA